jgi:hypothetical protein
MRKFRVLVLVLVAVLALGTTAFAANPHFVWVTASINSGGSLVVKFKEAGLGNNQLVHIVVGASAQAAYACRNNGGNFPADPKKHWASGQVSAGGDFRSGKNGQVTGQLVVPAPTFNQPSDPCPGNQHWVLVAVRYTGIYAQDTTNGVYMAANPSSVEKLLYKIRFDPWNP